MANANAGEISITNESVDTGLSELSATPDINVTPAQKPILKTKRPIKIRRPKKPVKSKIFCCIAKEYFSEYEGLVGSLSIEPRIIVYKHRLRQKSRYSITIVLKNNGLYPRLFKYSTDCPEDVQIVVVDPEMHRYIQPDESINVQILMKPTKSNDINRRRHIFIESEHPNIIFEVPIVVLTQNTDPSGNPIITLPRCVPMDETYYEMLLYNPAKAPIKIKTTINFSGLTLNTLNNSIIPKRDFLQLLFSFRPAKLQPYNGQCSVKYGINSHFIIKLEFIPKSIGVHVSAGNVEFGTCKFERELKRSVTICNEGPNEVTISGNMLKDLGGPKKKSMTTSENSFFKEPGISADAISFHSAMMSMTEPSERHSLIFNPSANRHFTMNTTTFLKPFTSEEYVIVFHPVYDLNDPFDDSDDPPYLLCTKLFLCFMDKQNCFMNTFLIISGLILGPEIELHPKVIELRKIYIGEEHCAIIKVLNVDGMLHTKVKFIDYNDPKFAGLRILPEEPYWLEPCSRGSYHMSFFATKPEKFNVVLRFKVINGGTYKVTVRGQCVPVHLRTFPQLVEFGTVPIAVPQKRYLLLMNPLSVPITVQVSASDDGVAQPLVLNIRDQSDIMPITVRDPVSQLEINNAQLHHIINSNNDEESTSEIFQCADEQLSLKSFVSNQSVYSATFEEEIMDPIPAMANHMLTTLKRQKIFDKSETDKRVIQEAMNSLFETKYFSTFTKHNHFVFMDWNEIPSDPKEIYCDSEIIYLRPNTGKSITVLIIPNIVGYFHRSLTVRVCPTPTVIGGSEDMPHRQMVKSKYLCSKLWFEYNCCIPDIDWLNWVNLTKRTIYAGEEYDFDMVFSNLSNVAGFLHFDVVPNEMGFRDGHWKFYIAADERLICACYVSFRTVGKTKLSGLIKIVGGYRPFPFHIIANVLPTEINVYPKFIKIRVNVLELTKTFIFIDNVTPTSTELTLKLETIYDGDQYLTTRGGILAPQGQSMYTTLVSIFYDPDLYRNKLIINLQYDNAVEIPISFQVEGIPLFFEPNIRDGFDAGLIYTTPKECYNQNFAHYCQLVKVTNKGRRSYRVGIVRKKCYTRKLYEPKDSACATTTVTARFDITPKSICLESQSHDYLAINASAYEECICYCEFIMDIVDSVYPNRVFSVRICMQAKFVDCDLRWNRRQINFNYERTHEFKEHPYIATPELINLHKLPADCVQLQVSGPFLIKELFEHQFDRQLSISLEALEHKTIFVMLNKLPLRDLYCKQVEGRVLVWAYGKVQKTLLLKVNVLIPEITILEPELVLFTRGREYDSYVQIVNVGCMNAAYIWRRLDVKLEYIGIEDNPNGIVADLLSEIMRMLDFNSEDDSEMNMTQRYRNYRCRYLKETDERNIVLDILDEIVNDLDLDHKRYHVLMDENMDVSPTMDASDLHDTSSFVEDTIDAILRRMKLEASYDVTPASSETCFSERSIYFYEKSDVLNKDENRMCRLHVPNLRSSFEARAVFQLEVVGGQSQMLNVTVVNLRQKIKFNRDNVYLGIKPWYELFKSSVRVFNVTKYPLQLMFEEIKEPQHEKRLICGNAKLLSENNVSLEPLDMCSVQHEGLLGFSECFQRVFRVSINRSAEEYMRLRGQGVMPILSMTSSLPPIELDPFEICQEYLLLMKIYQFEMFKTITVLDGEAAVMLPEEEQQMEDVSKQDDDEFISISDSDSDEMSSDHQKEHNLKFFRVIRTYVLVNNNEELPNPIVLKQLLETEKYLLSLKAHPELYSKHQQVYQNYLKLQKTYDTKMPVNIKHYTVQSLPFELHGNILDLGKLKVNTVKRFEFVVHFFGPGKLIASARTAVKVPGLVVDFKVEKHFDKKFMYWSEKCKSLEFFQKKYRNMFERLMDAELDPKIKHAHSFDIDEMVKHQREISLADRRKICDYYNSLNTSIYEDHKHHFTLCKIFTKTRSNFSGVDLRVVGLLKPNAKYYYSPEQLIEEFLYIDLHMGPTLPILMRGFLTKS